MWFYLTILHFPLCLLIVTSGVNRAHLCYDVALYIINPTTPSTFSFKPYSKVTPWMAFVDGLNNTASLTISQLPTYGYRPSDWSDFFSFVLTNSKTSLATHSYSSMWILCRTSHPFVRGCGRDWRSYLWSEQCSRMPFIKRAIACNRYFSILSSCLNSTSHTLELTVAFLDEIWALFSWCCHIRQITVI